MSGLTAAAAGFVARRQEGERSSSRGGRRFEIASRQWMAHKEGQIMGFRRSQRRSVQATGVGGKIVGTLFLAVFLGMGLLFAGLLARDVIKTAQTRFWRATPCTIVESGVSEEDGPRRNRPYVCVVQYRYDWEGRTFTSTRMSLDRPAFSDYAQAAALVARFPSDSRATCYVNPKRPEEAVLEHGDLWLAFSIVIPLIFVAVGGGGIYLVWKSRPAGKTAGKSLKTTPRLLSRRPGAGCLVGFFALFFLVGSGFLYGMFLRPLYGVWQSRNWPVAPCTIESSRVQSHRDSDGTTYKVDILYTYEFNGVSYKSSRYQFFNLSSSGRSAKTRLVREYPRGKETVCYVNPNNPTEAVLNRGITGEIGFIFLPLAFILVGLGGMIFALRRGRRAAAMTAAGGMPTLRSTGHRSGQPAVPTPTTGSGPVLLKPASTPLKGFILSVVFALFWNGIVSVFLTEVIREWSRGRSPWFLTIFLIPFVLVGLILIAVVITMFLKLFNPRVRLMVSSVAPRLGGELKLSWVFTGAVSRLRELDIALEAREEATYRRGTTTHTDSETFLHREIFRTRRRAEIRAGQCGVTIPADSVPSLDTGNNKILWSLKVHGDIAHWPDVDDEFPLTVLPLPVEARAAADPVVPLRVKPAEGDDA